MGTQGWQDLTVCASRGRVAGLFTNGPRAPHNSSAPPAPNDLDDDLRRASLVLYGMCVTAALVVDLVLPWPGLHRLALLVCALAGGASVPIVYYAPWHRAPRNLFLVMPLSSLVLIGAAIAASGGWVSPFAVDLTLVVGFGALFFSWRYALGIALLAGLVHASPVLYQQGGRPLVTALTAVSTYVALAYAVNIMMHRARAHERAVTAATLAREQTERRARGLLTLQRVSTLVGGHLRLDDVIQAIIAELERNFGHQLISVYLREGPNLVLRAQVGYAVPDLTVPLGSGIRGRVGATGTTVFVPDVRCEPAYQPTMDGAVSQVCVPLRDGAQVAGILNVESVGAPLTDLDRELLELFAVQVAVVLRNAQHAGELRRRADCDPLTGLLNHRTLMEALDRVLACAEPRCAVLLLDVDNFKLFNDSYGHLAGDAILEQVARLLRENSRHGDLIGRYGGDEFVVVLPAASRPTAEAVAARIGHAVHEQPYVSPDGDVLPLTLSCGVAMAPDDGATRPAVLAMADAAMYAAKRTPRRSRQAVCGAVAADGGDPAGALG